MGPLSQQQNKQAASPQASPLLGFYFALPLSKTRF
jgi:hypothetical protein